MNRIIGIISVWGAEHWVKLSIEQALSMCDEVIVNTGPYVQNMAKFEDNTKSICESFGDRITLVKSLMSSSHASAKAATLNHILSISKLYEVGNWIWLFDVDEFYREDQVDGMKDKLFEGDYNALSMPELYFFINTTRYLKNTRMRLWQIESTDHHFVPTNRWTGPRDKKLFMEDFKYFHYSALMNQHLKKELYKTECGPLLPGQQQKMDWVDKVYMPYELDNEEPWIELNLKLFGKRQPYWISDFAPDSDGKLFVYDDKHPQRIVDAGLTEIEDFRLCY